MIIKLIAAVALAAATVTPVMAASFYVVQDAATKKCTIVDTRPTVATSVIVSPDGNIYTSEKEAAEAIKTITVCEPK